MQAERLQHVLRVAEAKRAYDMGPSHSAAKNDTGSCPTSKPTGVGQHLLPACYLCC